MSGNKTKYTPTETIAAVEGLHRKRLYEMMANGDLTYETTNNGSRNKRLIDASELIRVFGDSFRLEGLEETPQDRTEKHDEIEPKRSDTSRLELEIQLLKERLEAKNMVIEDKLRVIDDLRDERNEWRKQAQVLLLPEGRPSLRPSLWSRIFGSARSTA